MTRETKIGLLVGLGFIVVFAVLLSHNGSTPSEISKLPPLTNPQSPAARDPSSPSLTGPVVSPGTETPANVVPVTGAHDPLPGSVAEGHDDSQLPAPEMFGTKDLITDASQPTPLDNSKMREAIAAAIPKGSPELEASTGRTAPVAVIEKPEPTIRSHEPVVTDNPSHGLEDTALARGTHDADPTGKASALVAESKTYTIKSGDTLVGITREAYKNSSPKVIDLVMNANKSTLKDRNSIVPGKTITIPALPAEMFVTTTVSTNPGKDLHKVGELINQIPTGGSRRAPEVIKVATGKTPAPAIDAKKAEGAKAMPASAKKTDKPEVKATVPSGRLEFIPIDAVRHEDIGSPTAPPTIDPPATKRTEKVDKSAEKSEKTDKSAKPQPTKKSDRSGRWYQVRPNDTFSSIAERELGSRNRWAEIKQLNKDVDPSKMKPGAKIRLPNNSRESLSADASNSRVTA